MTPIQQMLLGAGSAKKKVYSDEVFSTDTFWGYPNSSGNSLTVNNGIDFAGEGGLTWFKYRDMTGSHALFDTVRGVTKGLESHSTSAEYTVSHTALSSYNSNGYTISEDANGYIQSSGQTTAAWSFRKAPGFFDIVTWTRSGTNGSARTLDHSLGCVPGFIMLKQLDSSSESWICWHTKFDEDNQYLKLNHDHASGTDANASVNSVSSTQFVVGADNNKVGSYIAYLFAGGQSPAATAVSVDFNADSDAVYCGSNSDKSSDLNFGSGDFTWECWIKPDETQNDYPRVLHNQTSGGGGNWATNVSAIIWDHNSQSNRVSFFVYNQDSGGSTPLIRSHEHNWNADGQWHHIAVSRSGNTFRIFADGVLEKTETWTGSLDDADAFMGIGQTGDGSGSSESFRGSISNVRIVKGTAVYTSSFRVPTEPLTNITNTKLLCCQNSQATSATVSPTSLTSGGSPTVSSSDSPFDDPAAFTFGDSKEGIIKCGGYIGNGSADGPNVFIGWEPQWWLVKKRGQANWQLLDSIRGWRNGSNDTYLVPNTNTDEGDYNFGYPTSTGFKLTDNSNQNNNLSEYYYVAIRRPDGYVGKPIETGTDVFATDTGGDKNTIPNFDSGFPVDLAIRRRPATQEDWRMSTRLTSKRRMFFNTSENEGGDTGLTFDSNKGWEKDDTNSDYYSWMWRRHAGFDVVSYKGTGTAGHQIPHSLNKIPTMIWVKNRDTNGTDWMVYHSGLNGGTNPHNFALRLDHTDGTYSNSTHFGGAPTATYFTVGTNNSTNKDTDDHLALLFTDVSGVSKIGTFSGVSSNANLTIDLGFVPRLFIQKRIDSGCGNESHWYIWDSGRGLGSSGNEKPIFLNSNAVEGSAFDYVNTVNSGGTKGITLTGGVTSEFLGNDPSNHKYIYYAHA